MERTVSIDRFKDAKKWLDIKFQGNTIYEDHPLVVVYEALEIASNNLKNPYKPVEEPFKCEINKKDVD